MSSALRTAGRRLFGRLPNVARAPASAAKPSAASFSRAYHTDGPETTAHLERAKAASPFIAGQLASLKNKEVWVRSEGPGLWASRQLQTANVSRSKPFQANKYDPAYDESAHELQHLADYGNGASRGDPRENLHLEFRAFQAQETVSNSLYGRPPVHFVSNYPETPTRYHSAAEQARKYEGKKNYPGTLEESTAIFNSNRGSKGVPPVGS